jgi:inhibitor of cysteine peptidase
MVNCTFSTNSVAGGAGGDGGDGGFNAGNGGNGGIGGGGGVYNNGGRTDISFCTFSGSSAAGGNPGVAGSGAFAGHDGSVGPTRGGNIGNGTGTFLLNSTLLSTPTSGTNSVALTNVTCTTNITGTTNIVGGVTNVSYTTNVDCSTNVTMVVNSSTTANSYGTITDTGYNISSDASLTVTAPGSKKNTDPKLLPLADNGGFTMTFALSPDSPAVDGGDPESFLDFDQRGVERIYGVEDAGSYELEVSTITGTVFDTTGTNAFPGVLVTLTGDTNLTATTGADGTYSFKHLPLGDYTVTASKSGFVFDPPGTDVSLDAFTGPVDFTAIQAFSVSGRIRTSSTNGLGGVSVAAGDATSTTDANGNYTLVDVRPGDITVTAELIDYGFTPLWGDGSGNLTVSSNTVAINFQAYKTLFILAGHITQNGFGIGGVTVDIGGGVPPVSSDASGFYSFSDLPPDSYLVSPSHPGYDFIPPVQSVDLSDDDTNVDFTASGFYSIGGQVLEGGVGASNVTVNVVAGTNIIFSTQTDANGNYTVADVGPRAYSVVPSLADYVFSPASRSVTVPPNAFGTDFTAVHLYNVSGHVLDGASGLANAIVTAVSTVPPITKTSSSGSDGSYLLTNVPAGSISITATYPVAQFDPNPFVLNLSSNTTGIDFKRSFSISGRVTEGATTGVSNVTVTASNQVNGIRTSLTDTNGNYTISGVLPGTNVVRPVLAGYNFTNAPASVNIVHSNVAGINFSGVGTLSISGVITTNQSGGGLSNVSVTAGTKTTTSRADGSYIFTNLSPKTYTVTPILSKYTFDPLSRAVPLTSTPANNVNFTGIPVFSISGHVREGPSTNLAGVTITAINAAGPITNTVVSDSSGNYTLTGVRLGTNTVTASLAGFQFIVGTNQLASNQVVNLTANTNLVDFVGTRVFTVQGRVLDTGTSLGLSNVSLTLGTQTVLSDTNGNYIFTGIRAGTNTVTPSLSGYSFSPASQTNIVTGPNRTGIDFSATGVYVMAGRITRGGAGVQGVIIRADTRQGASDANGYYTINNLGPRTYTVTPSLAGSVFNPLSRSVNLVATVNNIDFTAIPTFSLNGRVTDGTNGPGLSTVTISAVSTSPSLTNSAVSDVNGNYTLSNVPATDNTLTPSVPGYLFSPATQSLTVTTNTAVPDFVGLRALTISGQLLEGANGLPGVRVTAGPASATSDSAGNYVLTLQSGSYTVQPATNGIGFNPQSAAVNLTSSTSGINFIARPVRLSLTYTNPVKVTVLGVPLRSYNIQAATNFSNFDWQTISTPTTDATNGLAEFLDTSSTNFPARLYRTHAP